MYLNGYSLRIPEGVERPGGYVEIEHGRHYRLTMRNNNDTLCDARVEIDGKHVGTWRIGIGGSITIERPVHDEAKFTAYMPGTYEGHMAGLDESDPNLGLIKVTFTPEKRYVEEAKKEGGVYYAALPNESYRSEYQPKGLTSTGAKTLSIGTGLSGHSSQQFGVANNIVYDYSRQTVIHLRLVAPKDNGPRPLTSWSTPVPPRL